MGRRSRIALYIVLIALIAFVALRYYGVIPASEQICTTSDDKSGKDCASYDVTLVFLWKIGILLNDFAVLIGAAAGGIVAFYTFTLWKATKKLSQLARRQEKTSRVIERAYVKLRETDRIAISRTGDFFVNLEVKN